MSLLVGNSLSDCLAFIKVILPLLLGNMFILLLAGHEVGSFPSSPRVVPIQFLQTAANTLCFSFALLALYPGEQERLYHHIKGIMSGLNGIPVGYWSLKLYVELTFRRPTKI